MPTYNEDHRNAFLELATEVGPHRARERLGYPGARTATRWMQGAGLDWSKAPDAVLGRALRQAYSDGDLLSVGAALLDELMGNLAQGVEHQTASGAVVRLRPSPDELFKLAGTFARVVDQLRLIRGRSTANVEPARIRGVRGG